MTLNKVIPLLAILVLIPSVTFAQMDDADKSYNIDNITPDDTLDDILDITSLKSYELHPDEIKNMLDLRLGEPPLTKEFGQAFDELNLIMSGEEGSIQEKNIEFLESLQITTFGTRDDATLSISVHPSQSDRLDEIKKQFAIMYPNVKINVGISVGLVY